jgi:hypothetical protein
VTSTASLVLSAVLVIGAVISAIRLVVGPDGPTYLGGRSSDAAHLLMNASMAAMLVVPATVLPPAALLVLYAAIAVVFAGLVGLGLARPTPPRRLHRPAHIYHVVASAAMVWAVHVIPDMAGMAGMAGMEGSAHQHLAAIPVAAWVLAGLFALDALGTLVLLKQVTDRGAVVPHVIMDVGMVWMLVPASMLLAG